jgi:hypothetical protein
LGGACLLRPGVSDVDLFRYCQGVIYFDAQISDGAFDFCVPEQHLDHANINVLLQEMGGKAVPQRMRRYLLLDPGCLRSRVAGPGQLTRS